MSDESPWEVLRAEVVFTVRAPNVSPFVVRLSLDNLADDGPEEAALMALWRAHHARLVAEANAAGPQDPFG